MRPVGDHNIFLLKESSSSITWNYSLKLQMTHQGGLSDAVCGQRSPSYHTSHHKQSLIDSKACDRDPSNFMWIEQRIHLDRKVGGIISLSESFVVHSGQGVKPKPVSLLTLLTWWCTRLGKVFVILALGQKAATWTNQGTW
jgi:hypothetical protein